MNKEGLVKAVATNLNTSKANAERTVNAVLEAVRTGLKADGTVQLIGFGSFTVKKLAARQGRNPQTGAVIKIAPKKTVKFKPSKDLKEYVKKTKW